MKEDKKSIIENALTDYNEIKEAAELTASKKLAEEFPEKFQNLLKEELNNNKNNSEKESYKKVDKVNESKNLDESEPNKESVMKKEVKETKKEVKKKVVTEERDKDFMGAIEGDTPNLGKGETEKGDTFVDNVKPGDTGNLDGSEQPISNLKEEFDVTELDIDNVDSALDSAEAGDEVISLDEIEKEISEMELLKGELEPESDPFDQKIGAMKNQLQEMLNSLNEMNVGMAEQKNQGGKQSIPGREKGGPTTQMIDEEDVDEQKNQGGKQSIPGREKGGPTTQMIDEEDVDINNIDDGDLDEAMGMAHSSSKHVAGDHLPGKDFAPHRHKRVGSVNNESVKKQFTSLLNENKKLTKKINESKKFKGTVDQLLENYKTALGKYRNQLKEMAVYNTNLAHVNNLLVNETLALTQEDKVKIISDFKSVGTISESKKKYNSILTEMKETKKPLTESIEEKVTDSVASSSKQKLDEVVESTAYKNDKHLNRMREIIESIEKKDKKII